MKFPDLVNRIFEQYGINVVLSDESPADGTTKQMRISFGKKKLISQQVKVGVVVLLRSLLNWRKMAVTPEFSIPDVDSYVISGKPPKNSKKDRQSVASSPSSPSATTNPSLNIQDTGSNFSTPKKKKSSSPFKPKHSKSDTPSVPSPLSTPESILLRILSKEYLRLHSDLTDCFWHKVKDFFGLRDCLMIALKMQILDNMIKKLEAHVSVGALVSEVFTVADLKQQQNPILDLFVLRTKSRTYENLSTDIQSDANLAQYIPSRSCGMGAA